MMIHACLATLISSGTQILCRSVTGMACLSICLQTLSDVTPLLQLEGVGTTCNVTLTAPRHMKPPIYLYYELDNYYQNHRR